MQSNLETRVGVFILAALAIFMYMGFKIGAFRLDRMRYNKYTVYFKDISELSRKSDVKIAGVKVGWVEEMKLVEETELQAEVEIMVLKEYSLYRDAYAIVRQEGLLGPKYIELIPGDPLLPKIAPGGVLQKTSVTPVSVDELMHSAKKIARNVESVTDSLNGAIGGVDGQEQLKEIFDNLQHATERFASFSEVLDRTFANNEENISDFLEVGKDIRKLAARLEESVLPAFQESIEKIAGVFDRDFERVSTKFASTADAVEDATLQARDGFKNVTSITEKIDNGQGTLGKLINEDETYRDVKVAVGGLKNYFAKVDQIQIVFDVHTETMGRPAENYRYEDSKGYFDIRIHSNQDHFYLVQLASSQKGWRFEYRHDREYLDTNDDLLDQNAPTLPLEEKLRFAPRVNHNIYERNTVKLGLQFGKVYSNLAFRLGLFEGTPGLGFDLDVPLPNDKFRWVTTFEVFDSIGWNRLHDRRPHLKWLNRMFLFESIYFTFGADDFVSKRNANIFFGMGLRWGDDDIKYLMSSLSAPLSTIANGTPIVIGT